MLKEVIMLQVKTKRPFKSRILDDAKKHFKKDKVSADEILDYMFGVNYYNHPDCEFIVKQYETVKTKPIHRLNALWVYPTYAVFVAPWMWLFTGHTGTKEGTKLAKVLSFFLGEIY